MRVIPLSFSNPLAQIAPDQEPTPIGCLVFKELRINQLADLTLLPEQREGRIIQAFPAASTIRCDDVPKVHPLPAQLPQGLHIFTKTAQDTRASAQAMLIRAYFRFPTCRTKAPLVERTKRLSSILVPSIFTPPCSIMRSASEVLAVNPDCFKTCAMLKG